MSVPFLCNSREVVSAEVRFCLGLREKAKDPLQPASPALECSGVQSDPFGVKKTPKQRDMQ